MASLRLTRQWRFPHVRGKKRSGELQTGRQVSTQLGRLTSSPRSRTEYLLLSDPLGNYQIPRFPLLRAPHPQYTYRYSPPFPPGLLPHPHREWVWGGPLHPAKQDRKAQSNLRFPRGGGKVSGPHRLASAKDRRRLPNHQILDPGGRLVVSVPRDSSAELYSDRRSFFMQVLYERFVGKI